MQRIVRTSRQTSVQGSTFIIVIIIFHFHINVIYYIFIQICEAQSAGMKILMIHMPT